MSGEEEIVRALEIVEGDGTHAIGKRAIAQQNYSRGRTGLRRGMDNDIKGGINENRQ